MFVLYWFLLLLLLFVCLFVCLFLFCFVCCFSFGWGFCFFVASFCLSCFVDLFVVVIFIYLFFTSFTPVLPSLSLMCTRTTNLMPQTSAVHTRKLMTKTCVCTQDRPVTVKLMPHVCVHTTMVMPDMPVCVHAAKIMPHACVHTTTFNATDLSLFTINEKYTCSDFTLRTQCQMHVFTQRGLIPRTDLSVFSI